MFNHTVPTRFFHTCTYQTPGSSILSPPTLRPSKLKAPICIFTNHILRKRRFLPVGSSPLVKWRKMMAKWWLKYVSAWFWLVVNKGPLIVLSTTTASAKSPTCLLAWFEPTKRMWKKVQIFQTKIDRLAYPSNNNNKKLYPISIFHGLL